VRGLSKRFGDSVIYDRFDLDLPRDRLTAIFGPNGCGKSTLINLAAGLIPRDGGVVEFAGRPIAGARLSYVFQNYRDALFPWLRAIDNIQYPLRLAGLPRAERRRRAEALVAEFGIRIDLHRYPYELSGGQQQTISILRAVITEPEILFLDEPFSALDYELTLQMRQQLQAIIARRRMTTILVSHDLDEAVQLADHVLLLTRRPTRVADMVAVDLPRPRTIEALTDAAFVAAKQHCLTVFRNEIAGTAPS
jgi:NitT/TauT family transport system ATP-binding protein